MYDDFCDFDDDYDGYGNPYDEDLGDEPIDENNPDERAAYDDDEDDLIDGVGFADPAGGNSALRAATRNNPRDQPCPNCGRKNVLTRIDRQRGYVCDHCADIAEGRMGGAW